MRVATSTTGVDKTTSVVATDVKDEKRFSRRSLIVVLFAVTLLLLGIGFRVYRFTLPTEGWSLHIDFEKGLIFDQNLLGMSSPLRQGDILLNVAGESLSVEEFDPFAMPSAEAQAAYRAGNAVQYQVQRGDETLSVDVPLYHWTAAGIAKAFFWEIVTGRNPNSSIFILLQFVIALFVFIKRPNNRAAQLLLLIGVGTVVSNVSGLVATITPGDAADPLARIISYLFGLAIHSVLLIPLFLHLALIFPEPKWGFQKSIWPVIALYGLPLPLDLLGEAHLIPNFSDALTTAYISLSIIAFIYSLGTVKHPEQRAQTKWVAYGGALFGLGLLIWVSINLLGWLPPSLNVLARLPWDLILAICLAVAILKYRLFDIDLIINRTLVYCILSLGVVGLYLGLVTGSSYLLQTQSNIAVSLIAVALILFLLKPFYQLLQSNANRFIPMTPMNHMMSATSSEFTTSHSEVENFSPRTDIKERKSSRSSLVVILFAAALLLLGLGFKAYRFTLPTEGWSLQLDFGKGLIFDQNLLGVSSPLQQGDILLNIAGESMDENDPFALPNPAAQAAYHVGNTVQYQVQRGDETLSFDVPLYSWTATGIAKAFWQVVLNRVSQFNVFTLLQLAVALFVFIKRPNNLAAQLLLLSNVGSLVSGVNWVGAVVSPGDTLDPLARVTSYLFGMAINPALLVPLFLHLAMIFPKPKWGFQKSIWPVTLLYGLPLLLYVLRDSHLLPTLPADAFVPLYFLLSMIAFIYSLVKVKDSEQRAQIKWVVYGGAVQALGSALWVASNILQWLPQSVFTYLQWLPWDFILPLCLAIAILQYRLFDIDVIINRTLVYGTLSLGVAGLYLGVVTGSSYLLQTQSNIAISLIAVAVILFFLKPFYQLLQSNVNRFIPVTPMNYMMSGASSEFTTSSAAEHVPPQTDNREKNSRRSARLVISFAIALISFSVVQKAYRFTLPSEGWSATTDFDTDNPIFVKNLLGLSSELQAGDRVIAVEGIAFTTLLEQSSRSQKSELNYEAGQTLRYTVLRNSQELNVNVPLYPGSSLGLGTVIKEFFTSNDVGDLFVWLQIFITLFIFWKRPNQLTARLMLLQITATIASAISWTVTPLSVAEVLRPSTLFVASFFSHWIHLTLEQPLGLHIILSFPKPHALLQKRWSLPLLYGLPLLVCVLGMTSVLPTAAAFIVVALYNLLGLVFVFQMFFTKRDLVATAQVRWFSFGYALSNLGMVFFGLSVAGLVPEAVSNVTELIPFNLFYLLCIAIAILRYRLFDIDLIINRTLVYGGLTLSVISLYVLVVGGLGRLIQTQGNLTLSLFATGLVAVVFQPLRQRLQKGANRLLYGERDDPYKVLSKLSERMEGTVEPSKLLPTMTETIAQTLKLPFAAIALGQNNNMQIVASHGAAKSASVTLPLAYQGETVGELRLEPRAGETFKQSELNLLKTIAQQASVAAHTVKQHLDLQHSREALVTAREEERLRIRRDLHDGLGPELASLTLKLDATRNVLKRDTDKAEILLIELKHQTQDAIASIRRLVYALRPPALDELGLESALREQARSYENMLTIELKTVGDLTNLPAASEVACYRIAQEALTNVVRHSRAKNCAMTLCATDKLSIDVQDDGIGISQHYRTGVGLRSMRERAEELGGKFTLTSSEKGTRLLATLPLMGKEEKG